MLSKEQYMENWNKLEAYVDEIVKTENDINTIRSFKLKKANELKLKYVPRKDGGIEIIPPWKLPEYQEIKITKEVIVPRVERQSSCNIAVLSKNFKDQMLGSIDYTNNTNREVYYELCETPSGKRMTSPSFGSSKAVKQIAGKCQKEFGASSKPIAEFHTHPDKYDNLGGFSGGDLLSYYNSDPEKVNCVVKEIKSGNTKNIRVRCAKSKDVQNFLGSVDWIKSKNITEKNATEFGDAVEGMGERVQQKFSCFVDFPLGSKFKELSQIKKEQKKKAPKFYKKTFGEEKELKQIKKKPKSSGGFDFGGGFQL